MPPAVGSLAEPAPQSGLDLTGRQVYCIGIGGCGLSGLARLLAESGAHVSGSDQTGSDLIDALVADGIPVTLTQHETSLPKEVEVVISSAAIGPDHVERNTAVRRGLLHLGYAETLGIVQASRTGVSIAGTHGKSTTAAILCHALLESGLDPGFIIGATCPQIGGGSRIGAERVPRTGAGDDPYADRAGILVAEACEFNRSFLHHRPKLALVNNVEEDHLDVYESLDAIIEAFAGFARLVPADGRLFIAHDGAHRETVTRGVACPVTTFGFDPEADVEVRFDPRSMRVDLLEGSRVIAGWTNPLPGAHNALNAAAAALLAKTLGAGWAQTTDALSGFRGVDRRMQRLGTRTLSGGGGVTVYDDYGHHPTEIDATLRALRSAERPRRLVCVFQPHQHSRTRFLLEGFARAFSSADIVIVPHIYFVRDSIAERHRVSAADLVSRLQGRGVTAMHIDGFEGIVEQLEGLCRDGDLVVVMGAGPVWQIAKAFLERRPS